MNLINFTKMLLLEWSHNCNKDGIIYEAGFNPQIMLDAIFDRPEILREETLATNQGGEVKIKRSVQKQYCVFEVCNIPDTLLNTFFCIRDHSDIVITDLETCERYQVLEYEFTPRNQDDCFNVGRFRLLLDSKVSTSCCATGAVQIS